jgi:LPS-assembly protein
MSRTARALRPALLGLALMLPAGAPLGQSAPPAPVPTAPAPTGAPASLSADQVTYDRERRLLVASGNVEVLYQGRVLRAARITYDEAADEIRAEGPLVLTDPEGGVLIADSAALTPDLAEGLISSARLLIAGRMQLATTEARRSGGRYETLQRTIASSCTICAENPTPTWAIRASRVIQDEVAQRIYFENARLEMFGVPVGFLPRLSIPSPGVERASGFLAPSFAQSEIYGFGVKLPYYNVLGPSADVTIAPFITTSGGVLLETEYRRRFTNGGFDLWGVIAATDGLNEEGGRDGGAGRGAFTAVGAFRLPYGFVGDFDLAGASDDSFLTQYDYSDTDLLTSTARLHRSRPNDYLELGTVAFQSLVEDDDSVDVPFVLPEFSYRRIDEAPLIGGRFAIDLNSLGILRRVGSNSMRAGGILDWQRDWSLPYGLRASTTAATLVDVYQIWDNPEIEDGINFQAAPTASVELRWPLVRHAGRADHVIEPIAQIVYSETMRDQSDFPNEDSRLPEFDVTNLFSLNRFPGLDRVETGLRANLGVSYTRYDQAGWSLGLTLGRVLRSDDQDDFPAGTGLTGRWSDYVGALSLGFGWGLDVVNRSLFDSDFNFRRNEFALAYGGERGDLRAAYVYLAEDDSNPILGVQPETNELALDARVRVHPNWELRGLWRYDAVTNSNLRAGVGVTYGNECAEFDLSVSRRYTSSSNVPPSTSIGFSLRLAGLGAEEDRDWPPRVCMARAI